MTTTDLDLGKYKLGWSDEEDYVFKPKKGLSEEIVREMSSIKNVAVIGVCFSSLFNVVLS